MAKDSRSSSPNKEERKGTAEERKVIKGKSPRLDTREYAWS